MFTLFSETLRRLRSGAGLSQRELAERMNVTRPTVVRWETGLRMPDMVMLSRLAEVLGVEISAFFPAPAEAEPSFPVILADADTHFLDWGLAVLEEALPGAQLHGFTGADEALAFAREKRVQLAFLEITLGQASGLELCRELLSIEPRTNVVFLTDTQDHAFLAWDTGACGYLLKPLTAQAVHRQLSLLRHPLKGI